MRLDPHNPSRYFALLGMAHFCRGELAEAAALSEKALRLNPENVGMGLQLAAFYGLLGRDQEAQAALESVTKKLRIGRLEWIMFGYPFAERAVADRYAEGLRKAGVSGRPSGYLPALKENQLTGEEIRALLFGSRITEMITLETLGMSFEVEFKKNGETTLRDANSSDSGKSRIEGDMICTQCQKRWWGLENCATVFRNPLGTLEGKDEYFFESDIGFLTFSPLR
jgi:tetratricopeptide (TPR) repeat protein